MDYNNLLNIPSDMLKAIKEDNFQEYSKSIPEVSKYFMQAKLDTETDKKIKEWLNNR